MSLNTKLPNISKTTAMLAMLLTTGLATMHSAQAGVAVPGGWTRSSTVDSSVTNNNNGTWTYGYTVNNTSRFTESGPDREPFVVDWELPWFGDAGIDLMSILSPSGWSFNIETIGTANFNTGWEGVASWQDPADPFYAGATSPFTGVTQVLHWYSVCWAAQNNASVTGNFVVACLSDLQDAIAPGDFLDGFSFVADFDQTDAPYQASWAFLPVRSGDPAFPLGGIPASPLALGTQVVPEPGLLSLLGIGLVAVMLGRRRRA